MLSSSSYSSQESETVVVETVFSPTLIGLQGYLRYNHSVEELTIPEGTVMAPEIALLDRSLVISGSTDEGGPLQGAFISIEGNSTAMLMNLMCYRCGQVGLVRSSADSSFMHLYLILLSSNVSCTCQSCHLNLPPPSPYVKQRNFAPPAHQGDLPCPYCQDAGLIMQEAGRAALTFNLTGAQSSLGQNNVLYDSRSRGIALVDAGNVTLRQNLLTNTKGHGLLVNGSSVENVLAGNLIIGSLVNSLQNATDLQPAGIYALNWNNAFR